MRYVQPVSSEEGRLLSSTPDGKWMIEIHFERSASVEVNVSDHMSQRDTRMVDRIIKVTCWEASLEH